MPATELPSLTSALDERLQAVYRERTRGSAAAYARALDVLPGGDTRTGTFFLPYPTFMARGEGCRLYDVDGNAYIDFLGNFTSLIHGHAHPKITAAIAEQAGQGTALSFPSELQVQLASEIRRRVPSVERLRFCNSGTEAVMGAIRVARAFTGRPKILKMEGGYHGSYDAAQMSITPGEDAPPLPMGTTEGPGLSPGMTREVLVAPFNDLEKTASIARAHQGELAAVLLEPAMTAAGVIPADPQFLRGLRELTRELGVLLIMDEIITFRFAFGGGQSIYGITPDLTTFGKIIGGGLPVGAFGGRADVMALFDPRRAGTISHSGTFNGNAATMAAGLVALELLDQAAIDRLNAFGERMRRGLQGAFDAEGVPAFVSGLGSLAHIHYQPGRVRDYRASLAGKRWAARVMHLALHNAGFVGASRGMLAASTVMTTGEIDALIAAARAIIADAKPLLQ
jgi:glutamate-1-semialdehyde 2,1-aminomutase